MYTKDKDFRVTVRLSKKQNEFVEHLGKTMKMTSSDVLRMLLSLYMSQNEHG